MATLARRRIMRRKKKSLEIPPIMALSNVRIVPDPALRAIAQIPV
jgi:hypothetical protein